MLPASSGGPSSGWDFIAKLPEDMSLEGRRKKRSELAEEVGVVLSRENLVGLKPQR